VLYVTGSWRRRRFNSGGFFRRSTLVCGPRQCARLSFAAVPPQTVRKTQGAARLGAEWYVASHAAGKEPRRMCYPDVPRMHVTFRDLMAPDTEPTDEELALVMREARDLAVQRRAAADAWVAARLEEASIFGRANTQARRTDKSR